MGLLIRFSVMLRLGSSYPFRPVSSARLPLSYSILPSPQTLRCVCSTVLCHCFLYAMYRFLLRVSCMFPTRLLSNMPTSQSIPF